MLDLIAIGDIKLDTFIALPDAQVRVFDVDDEPFLGVPHGRKTPVPLAFSQPAGTAPNVAIAVQKFRRTSAVLSVMGDDATHLLSLDFLHKHGVDTRLITTKKGARSSSAIVLNHKGESTQLVAHGAFDFKLPLFLQAARFVHVAENGHGYEKLYGQIVRYAKRTSAKISINPGSVQIAAPRDALYALLDVAHVLFLNFDEAKALLRVKRGEKNIRGVMRELRDFGPEIIVVTDGRKGAYAFDGQEMYHAPMFPGKRVEATGAGDAFSSGFLGALLGGESVVEGLMYGSVNSASVVGAIGPTAGLLTLKEIRRRLNEHRTYRVKEL